MVVLAPVLGRVSDLVCVGGGAVSSPQETASATVMITSTRAAIPATSGDPLNSTIFSQMFLMNPDPYRLR